jgi:polysaccharide export outer membrane protein
MRVIFVIGIALLLSFNAAPAFAMEESTPVSEPSITPGQPAADEYRVGVGDMLEITVLTHEDLSRSATVQANGEISLPLLGDVPVMSLTVAEIKDRLTALLEKDFLVNPQVEVRVREFRSQYVTVVGEVGQAGRKALRGRTRVVDILVESGGFTQRASGEVTLTRLDGTFADGSSVVKFSLGGTSMTSEEQQHLEIELRNGDILTASPKYYVNVMGEVTRPNRFTLDGELTLMGAISMAGGLTRYGSNDIRLTRADPATGKSETKEHNLKAIRKGKKPDPKLQPNDIITVPRRLF